MRIAHFTAGIGGQGGIRSYVLALSKLQIDAGHEVFLFDTVPTGREPSNFEPTILRDESELFDCYRKQAVDILHYHTGPALRPPAGFNVVYTVHEHSPHCISGGLYLKRRNLPCPRTYNPLGCLHGHVRDRCGSVRPASFLKNFRRMKRQMEILPDINTICVGHAIKSKMISAGYPASKISVIPNFAGLDTEMRDMPFGDVPEFLFIGRIGRLKGLEWLLRSLSLVREPILLNVAGAGDAEHECRELVNALGLGEKVRFLGWVDRTEKLELFRSSRAVIVPSIWPEPFGLVAIEAAASARPAIVSNSGELPFIVEDGRSGIVVDVGNIDQLASAIERLAKEPDRAREMGLHSHRNFVLKYSPKVHSREIEALYRAVSMTAGFQSS